MTIPNPFAFISEIKEMNDELCGRLDAIIEKLDELISKTEIRTDLYGDGR